VIKSQNEKQYTEKKEKKEKRGPNWFSHLNWSSHEFHPQFWIYLTYMPALMLSYSSLSQVLSEQNPASLLN
jgi:hypothetical protein